MVEDWSSVTTTGNTNNGASAGPSTVPSPKLDASDDNAVWCYETPKPEVAAIAGRLAFYPDKVEISRNSA